MRRIYFLNMAYLSVYALLLTAVALVSASGRERRIVGGESPGTTKEIPFIGGIPGDRQQPCGVSLIERDLVVTAASCEYLQPDKVAIFGYSNCITCDGPYIGAAYLQTAAFSSEITLNSGYNKVTKRNDIALVRLKLSGPLEMTQYVNTIAPVAFDRPADEYRGCYIAGWGFSSAESGAGVLNVAETDIVEGKLCRQTFGDDAFDEDTMICAWSEQSDVCAGDTGGPLYCTVEINGRTETELVGIFSQGQEKCERGDPGIFTKVSAFHDWIEDPTTTGSTGGSVAVIPAAVTTFMLFVTSFII